MPDFSRWGGNGGDPSLNAIARTDRYLDALAAEQPVYATDPADAELAGLMASWRDDVRRPPARVASQRDAEVVLQRALSSRRRTRMSMAVVGSVAAALLCLGGFGAIVYGAGPGDALYGLRVSLFGERQVTRDDQVALAAQTEMQQVQQFIDQGNWEAAQDKLQTATSAVQTVEDPKRQEELQQQLNNLVAKVESRDPAATAPPPAEAPQPASNGPGLSLPFELPPGISLPPGLPQPPDISVPQVPGPLLPPDISLPQLPPVQVPGGIVPPGISLPSLPPLPSLPLPKPAQGDQKPGQGDQKPGQKPDSNDSKPGQGDDSSVEAPKPGPGGDSPVELPKPVEQPKPAPNPAPDQPKQVEQPKPGPAVEAPPSQEAPAAPEVPDVPAPKAPQGLAPPKEKPSVELPTTTVLPIPGDKPKSGD
ncbi:hypothetical protein DVS77_23645 [Mycolicibacterium moriokaense]|nr:hypothetical protein DVS77_23645 [Mycolicibacterium moriokaense]